MPTPIHRRIQSLSLFLLALAVIAAPAPGAASPIDVTFEDVNPDQSDTDPSDPDGATGGRVNGLAIHPTDNQILYAASEWGGIYSSADGGLNWARLDGHLPAVTWDVEIDPSSPSRVYATSFFDGKIASLAGINVSTDSGATWTKPATAAPPGGFCSNPLDETEPSAFGISIDPANSANVFIGTSCGLATSTNSGVTWTYRDPTGPAGSATRIWDVLALGGGVVHVCGDDGSLRSDDGGVTWVAGTGLPSGRCSLAVSPDESYVLLAVVGTTIYETQNGGAVGGPTWGQTRTNPTPQGRIPFVATNQRSAANAWDLWFGDVSLFRVGCTTPTPPLPGGPPRCGTGNSPPWAGGFTRAVGGHDDTGAILFDSEAATDACPVLFSSDGGVYYNTDATADCHNPNWEQPDVTPHGLWPWTMSGADQPGAVDEDLYFGNQDNGVFGTVDAGSAMPTWHNEICCDGFDTAAEPAGIVYTVCCFGGGGRATRAFRGGPGFSAVSEIDYPPSGLLPGFEYPDSFVSWAPLSYVTISINCSPPNGGCQSADGGVFITTNIDANPVVWTELGNATEPPTNNICGVYAGVNGAGTPTFYAQSGVCSSSGTGDRIFRFTGTNPGGSWTEIFLPAGGFGVFAVDASDPSLLLASGLTSAGGGMYRSTDAGATWTSLPDLDAFMTHFGAFQFRNTRGPSDFTGFFGYWQPSLVGIDPNSNAMVAGGQDSGIFLSLDDGANWELITDPLSSNTSGIPHLPRPRYAYFDSDGAGTTALYVASQGRGIWRVNLPLIFADGFESGDTSAWSNTVP
ncbi:MAG: hypothetical protein OES32_06885 [Acidobacteriota bacterium]|nr:hypothetical protein [Acidobacteriota bacterium]MDH3523296.1 hypothetical protein [Acidobacteriota bacterium]